MIKYKMDLSKPFDFHCLGLIFKYDKRLFFKKYGNSLQNDVFFKRIDYGCE